MTLPLKPTRLEHTYEVGDDSGYRFKVVAEWKDDAQSWSGWRATVTMTAHGMATPEDAVEHLRHSAEAFLRQLDAKPEHVNVAVGQTWCNRATRVNFDVVNGPSSDGWWGLRNTTTGAHPFVSERELLESYELVGGAPDGVNAASVLGVQP